MWTDLIDFNPGAPASDLKMVIVLGVAAFLIALFFITPLIRKKTSDKALKKVLAKSRGGLMGFALGMLVLLWLRFETVPFLSMRLWFILLVLSLIGWFIWKIMLYSKVKKRIENAEARRNRK